MVTTTKVEKPTPVKNDEPDEGKVVVPEVKSEENILGTILITIPENSRVRAEFTGKISGLQIKRVVRDLPKMYVMNVRYKLKQLGGNDDA